MSAKSPFDVVRLSPLMARTAGSAEIAIAVIDGPVDVGHPHLASNRILTVPGELPATCVAPDDLACTHGTLVVGMLSGRRESPTPGICPGCTVLVLPIFSQTDARGVGIPTAAPEQLAAAIHRAIVAGARVVNLSVALMWPSSAGERALVEALDDAARRGVLVVAAAGNEGTLAGSVITRHPWVIPVVACDAEGTPLTDSTMGASIGRRGLRAPGAGLLRPSPGGTSAVLGGTSAAAPFVTGTIALLWSEFARATPAETRRAVAEASGSRRKSVVPPLLDALAAHESLASATVGRSPRPARPVVTGAR